MLKKWLNRVGLALTLVAFVGVVALVGCRARELGSTNFYGLDITVPTEVATATPGVVIDSAAVSAPFEIRKNHTPVFQVNGSGALDIESGLDVAGWARVVAPTSIASATPALRVNSSGVSALIEAEKNSTRVFEVTGAGNVDAEGSLDIASGAIIAAPTAQATAVPVLEVDGLGVSALIEARIANTPVWQVANDGDVSNPAGTLILADAVAVDGQEDAVQLTVQGNATQTSNPFVVEQSDGTDVFTVSNAGAIVVASTADIKGDVSDSGGTFTIADAVLIDGAADAIQLTVQGHSTQTSALMAVEESGGTDVVTIKQSPGADSGATVSLVEIAGANPINTAGTQTLEGLTVDLSVGDSSAGTNKVNAISIDGITGDAEVMETGILFGAGWDIDLGGSSDGLDMGVGSTVTAVVDTFSQADAGDTSSLLEVFGTTPIDTVGTNVHNGITVDLAIGNASGGTNSAVGVQIDGISGDAEVTETALNIGSGWDKGIVNAGTSDLQGDVSDSGGTFTIADDVAIIGQADRTQLAVAGYITQTSEVLAVSDYASNLILSVKPSPAADSGTATTLVAVAGRAPDNTQNTNTLTGLSVAFDAGEPSGGTNTLYGVNVDTIIGDAQQTETAFFAEDGWDYGLDINAPIRSSVDGVVEIDSATPLKVGVGTEHIGIPTVLSVPITYTAAAGGTGTVATVGAGEVWLVHEVWVKVTTNFDATGDDATLIVGDSNDTDGFLAVADAGLQAAYSAGTGWEAGYYGLKDGEQGAYVADGSLFIYDGAETIDWAVDETDGETLAAGAATIYVRYTRIS